MTFQIVSSGQVFSGTIGQGVTLEVASGGEALDVTAPESEGSTSGAPWIGLPTGTIGDATMYVQSGGLAIGTTIVGTEIVNGGVTLSSLVSGPLAEEFISGGGIASASTVADGGWETVSSGGIAAAATIEAGGWQGISAGGEAFGAVVMSGGTEAIDAGGYASGILLDGGSASLFAAIASNVVVGGGAQLFAAFSSFVGGATVSGGGQVVIAGAETSGVHVQSGGSQIVYGGGVASATTLDAGAVMVVVPGGVASGTSGSGTVISTGVEIGSGTFVISFTGHPTSAPLEAGETENVLPGGSAIGTFVAGEATQDVYAGGAVGRSLVEGFLILSSGGSASATVVSGGQETINSGAVGVGETIEAGRELLFGGFAGNSLVELGGVQLVASGAATSGVAIGGGGYEIVSAGGVVSAATVSAGGLLALTSPDLAPGTTVLPGGSIDLLNFAYSAGATATIDPSDLLTVSAGSNIATMQLTGNYQGLEFVPTNDGGFTGTLLELDVVPCYAAGTLIETTRGEVPVEALAEGDGVVTASGRIAPVRWIGRRRIVLARHPRRSLAQPVRIAAGAFGPGLPRRDLFLSPEHAVLVDGALIPIRRLVNATSVAVDRRFETVTYIHVELDRHDVMLAEGLPAESWLEAGNRAMFDNDATPFNERRGAAKTWAADACAPIVERGPLLEAARRRLGVGAVVDIPLRRAGVFRRAVPGGAAMLRLVSAVGAKPGDARALGVAVRNISLDGRDIPLGDFRLQGGFYAPESDWRWTDGAGFVSLDRRRRASMVTVEVAALAPGSSAC